MGSDLLSAKSVTSTRLIFDPSHCRQPRACIFADIYKRFVRRGRSFFAMGKRGFVARSKTLVAMIHRK